MEYGMKDKLASILKMAVALAAFAFISYRIYCQVRLGLSMDVGNFRLLPLMAVVALVPVNWMVEAKKWQSLTLHLQRQSMAESFRSVMVGLSVSMLTPNRIGDFAGRISTLKPENRVEATMASFVGSFALVVSIFLFGLVAFILEPVLPHSFEWIASHHVQLSVVLAVLAVAVVAFYFCIGKVAPRFSFRPWPWLERFVQGAGRHSVGGLFRAFAYSCLRYAVFSFQFYLALESVGVSLSPHDAFCSIALMYFFVTLIPTFALVEWGVRGSMALLFITPVGGLPTQVMIATIVVWLLNVAIPALYGAVIQAVGPTSGSKRKL